MAVTGLIPAIGIITVFIFIGVTLPFIQRDFDQSVSTQADVLESDITGSATTLNSVSAFQIVTSVAKMFFWTFGDLPFWLDMIFLVFRIGLILIFLQYLPFVG